MNFYTDSFLSALRLAFSFDPEVAAIVALSLKVSAVSTLLAAVFGIPFGFFLSFSEFRGKRGVITLLNTLLALPTVVIGLFVYSMVSRRGAFGAWDLIYTWKAMVIGQTILIFPLVAALTLSAVSRIDRRYRKTAKTLGAGPFRTALVVCREARFAVAAAIIAAFGRVIAEVGISMMLGGNAKGFTRTMTTAMALEYDKGEFILAVALGIILLFISFLINSLFHVFQGKTEA